MQILSTAEILKAMAEALPEHDHADNTSDVSTSYEVIALLAHVCMTMMGFELLGFDEAHKDSERVKKLAPRLDAKWNNSFGSHKFVYRHDASASELLLDVARLGNQVELRGLDVAGDRIFRFQTPVRECISSSALPIRIPRTESGEEDRDALAERIRKAFVSEAAILELAHQLLRNIVRNLIPGIQPAAEFARPENIDLRLPRSHPGQEERPRAERESQPSQPPQPPQPVPAEPSAPMARPVPVGDFPPPGFEDEYEMNQPPRGIPGLPGRWLFDIGNDDLNPPGLGPRDPLRPSLGPTGRGGPGGMHPTFDDPLFAGRGNGGGDDGLPPQVPPGARWDPLGPLPPRRGGPGGTGGPFGGGFRGDII